jgi:hypothetical protein
MPIGMKYLKLDAPATMGATVLLAEDPSPAFLFDTVKKESTTQQIGMRFAVCCPEAGFEKAQVLVEGLMVAPPLTIGRPVAFDGLVGTIKLNWDTKRAEGKFVASGVRSADAKKAE